MSSDRSRQQKLGRRGALLVLFGCDFTEYEAVDALEWTRSLVEDVRPEVGEVWDLVEDRVRGVSVDSEEIDDSVQEVSPNWKVSRMGVVDRNLLRIGAWEVFESDIPPIVTIDACVELGKDYGEESTPGFVNGLLDELCSREGIEVS